MDEKVFIYFGSEVFKPFHNIEVQENSLPNQTIGKLFSCIKTSNTVIEDVFLGWSILFIKADNFILPTGYGHENLKQKDQMQLKDISDISSGFTHSLFLSKSGKCSLFHNNSVNLDPVKYEEVMTAVKSIATEDLQTVVLTDDGKVCLINLKETLIVKPLPLPITINRISCGKEHVLMLSDSGKVFSYGFGSRGQLGHGSIENEEKPLLIEALDGIEIKSIASGGWHSAAISDCGDLYMWGWNEKGQLGLPCMELQDGKKPIQEIETVCCLPKIIELNCDVVKQVSCGSRHTAALTKSNLVYTWGWNGYGQLGHKNLKLSDNPKIVALPPSFRPEKIKSKFWSTLIIGISCAKV